jgi:hypothetical protein
LVACDDDAPAPYADDGATTEQEVLVRLARAARRAGALAAVLALTAGCGITHLQDLSFRVDHRLHFLSPVSRAKVQLPVTIRWRMADFTVSPPSAAPPSRHAGFFALFVDQAPIRPGQTLRAICRADPFARDDPHCPTMSYLHGKLVFPTTADSVTMPAIPNLAGDTDKVQEHTFIVVLMDTSGHRIGESAWELDLRLPRIGE